MVNIFWFRRDLRLEDNHGLYQALLSGITVLPIFIFDTAILGLLEDKDDARVNFIWREIHRLDQELQKQGSGLRIYHANPVEVFQKLVEEFSVQGVYANRDYEPYARQRDEAIYHVLKTKGIPFNLAKDQVIWEKDEVCKANGEPYTVFTPYARTWKQKFDSLEITTYPSEITGSFYRGSRMPLPSLSDLGFVTSAIIFPDRQVDDQVIITYDQTRDYPALVHGTSHLSIHLRFGTVSIRRLVLQARKMNGVFLNELIWREFYMMILWHFPQVVHASFKPAYDRIPWRDDPKGFEAWCTGQTGYPLVDAGMRELNATGYMHNRVRMVAASFLTKHLLIDWRWGEAYFARKLLDFELSSNNGGWQWAAGTGCDAAPYFRVFNPTLQAEKFDPDGTYQRSWLPELGTPAYPGPIIDHSWARDRAIETYRMALAEG